MSVFLIVPAKSPLLLFFVFYGIIDRDRNPYSWYNRLRINYRNWAKI